ncbi:MAG: hypothetical protein RID18_00200 [Cytophagales bacterium]
MLRSAVLFLFFIFHQTLFAQVTAEVSLAFGASFPGGDLVLGDDERAEHEKLAFQGMSKSGWYAELSFESNPMRLVGFSGSFLYHSFPQNDSKYEELINEIDRNYAANKRYTVKSSTPLKLAGLFIGPNFQILRKEYFGFNLKARLGFLLLNTPLWTSSTRLTSISIPQKRF